MIDSPTHSPAERPLVRVAVGTAMGRRLAEDLSDALRGVAEVDAALVGQRRAPSACRVASIGSVPLSGVTAVIDALDPFERGAVSSLRQATRRAGLPRLTFRTPVWERHPLDRWVEVRDLAGAVNAIASVARTALIWLPPEEVAAFSTVGGLRFPTRLTERPPNWTLPERFAPIISPPPYNVVGDQRMLEACGAQAVVMRATGSEQDAPLVAAARALDLPIVMIRRPMERGDVPARDIEMVVDWLSHTLDLETGIRTARVER